MSFYFTFILLLAITITVSGQAEEKINCSRAKNYFAKSAGRKLQTAHPSLEHYDVKFYFLDIEADNLSAFIKANVTMKAGVTAELMTELVLEVSDRLGVDSLFIDGKKVNFSHSDNLVVAPLETPFAKGENFISKIFYQGNGSTPSFSSGISNGVSPSWGNRVTWTLSEPLNAKDWFACKQVLDDKADSTYVFITVPGNLKAGSNGLLTQVSPVAGNKKRFEWKTRYPTAYYLISMAIAEYDEYNITASIDGKDILIQNFIYNNPGTLTAFKDEIDEVKDQLELFSELFGSYPFAGEKYGHSMAPLEGGMEHQTMTTLGYFEFNLDAHELSHQWFGDNVTCASWQDIWVNEGLARYSEYLALEYLRSGSEADNWMRLIYDNVLTESGGSVYVPEEAAEDENRIFDLRLTYNKGAALVHMIRNIVKDDVLFFDILKSYQSTFNGKVATGLDFENILEEKAQTDFSEFFAEWYYGEGYPIFKIEWNYDSDTLYIRQTQTTSSSKVPFYHTPVDYIVELSNGESTTIRLTATEPVQIFKIYNPEIVTAISFDPASWLLKRVNEFSRDLSLIAPSLILGIQNKIEHQFSIYPNPANEKVTVVSDIDVIFSFQLLDRQGVAIREKSGVQTRAEIDTRGFASGMYFLRVKSNHYSAYYKIHIVK
jgi:aminopeptidase N